MKHILFATLLFLFSTAKAQVFDSTKYYIIEAIIDDEDCSDSYLDSRQYLTFYQNEDGNKCFLNSKTNGEEFSCGRISGLISEEIIEDECSGELITFRWKYHNSYDLDSGYALVTLKKIYRESETQFYIKIITDKLDIIYFSGFTNEKLEKYEQIKNTRNNYTLLKTKNIINP
jgi:hypothetical protein